MRGRRIGLLAVALGAALLGPAVAAPPGPAAAAPALRTDVAPGGNFDLSVWSLQLPIGSPGAPTTIPPAQLEGADGYTNPAYFWTDKNDGSMTFWDPESGVTTPNSNYPRTELREMSPDGSAADWALAGTHRLAAELRVVSVTRSVGVGQHQQRCEGEVLLAHRPARLTPSRRGVAAAPGRPSQCPGQYSGAR
ncbi:MAG TPA: polysaccharide lyase family 7 protein [Actinocatenispora sp.]